MVLIVRVIRQLRFEGATIAGLARQLATTWNTVWSHIKPCLQAASDDPARFSGVRVLGVDEHVWHHQDRRRRGPREFTGIVDLTRGEDHPTARLLDLVPGRSGTVYKNWLEERGEQFRSGIQIATVDPFQGQQERLREAFVADEAHISVDVAYLHRASARGLPPSRTRPRPTSGRSSNRAPTSLSRPRNRSPRGGPCASGRTHSTPTSIQAEPATAPRKPSTDIIELGRRTARGYRNPTSYQLRMLLIAGGLDASTHTQL